MEITNRIVATFVLLLLMTTLVFVKVSVEQTSNIAYIEPPVIYTNVCENFTVTVFANVTMRIGWFDFWLNFDATQMSVVEVEILPPWESPFPPEVGVGYVMVSGTHYFVGPGSIPLVEITFHCDASGTSNLQFAYVFVGDGAILLLPWQGATVHQQWHFKAPFEDYAPSGLPDFDQRQDNWNNSVGAWTWCGPVAVSNSLWWFDSKFEPNPLPPSTINDGYPLVTAYDAWDDHDPANVEPFVNDLAWLMDTDGHRTGLIHNGTNVLDMEAGISQYLQKVGLNPLGDANGDGKVNGTDETIVTNAMNSDPDDSNWDLAADLNGDNRVDPDDLTMVQSHFGENWGQFYEKTVKAPTFQFIAEQIEKSEDVVILLGIWQQQGQAWVRIGGHFVTVAGVDSVNQAIAFSDPMKDNAELGAPGRVMPPPPPPHPHNPFPPFPLHNNASYISHDFYGMGSSPSPGGSLGSEDYEVTDIIENFIQQNIPDEFDEDTGSYDPLNPQVSVEVEYAVIVSPIPNVAITEVTLGKTVVGQGYTVRINVTAVNLGFSAVTFNVTTYYNAVPIEEKTVRNLAPDAETKLIFSWNTTGVSYGSYIISACVTPLQGEIHTIDNTLPDGTAIVVIAADVTANGIVDVFDLFEISKAYGSIPDSNNWNPNTDINDDDVVDEHDLSIVPENYGKTT